MASWARIELATYPLGDGFPDGIPIGNHMNIHHSCTSVALSIYLKEASTVPKLYRNCTAEYLLLVRGSYIPPMYYIAMEENKI